MKIGTKFQHFNSRFRVWSHTHLTILVELGTTTTNLSLELCTETHKYLNRCYFYEGIWVFMHVHSLLWGLRVCVCVCVGEWVKLSVKKGNKKKRGGVEKTKILANIAVTRSTIHKSYLCLSSLWHPPLSFECSFIISCLPGKQESERERHNNCLKSESMSSRIFNYECEKGSCLNLRLCWCGEEKIKTWNRITLQIGLNNMKGNNDKRSRQ